VSGAQPAHSGRALESTYAGRVPTTERLRRLRRATNEILSIQDIEQLAAAIVRAAAEAEGVDAVALMLAPEGERDMRIIAQHGLSRRYADEQRIPLNRARAVFRGPDVHRVVDLQRDALGDRNLVVAEGLAKALAVPIVEAGKLIGSLNLYVRDLARDFDAEEVEVAHVLAAQASVAIGNARLYGAALAQAELQRALLESLGDGVVIAWRDGRLAGINRVAREIAGLDEAPRTVAELRDVMEFAGEAGEPIPPEQGPLIRALRGEANRGVYQWRHAKTGELRTIELIAAPVYGAGGELAAAIMAIHDVTAQRRVEREKDEFLSIVSHELKTPLTPLKAVAQLLRARLARARSEGRAPDLDSFQKNLLTIERQVERMDALVNDLLEVSRAGRGRFELAFGEFDLAPVLHGIVQRFREAAEEEGRHTFEVVSPESLKGRGDRRRLEQMLLNLVGNAVKYSPSGGRVAVALEQAGADAVLTVRDEGIGITAEELPKLGRAFYRGGERAATYPGVGIGLYLTRLIAEGHGGSVELESPGEDQGTVVRIRLPRSVLEG
jgi:PAS domain S-box-containing protein